MTTTGYQVDATVIAAGGNVFVAPVGTTPPTGLGDPADPWENVGYISVDGATFTPTRETASFDSWQQKAFRIKSAGQTLQMSFGLLEFTAANLQLAFGGGTVVEAGDTFTWTPPSPTDEYSRAVIVDADDGARRYRFYYPNAAIAELGETTFNADNLAILPVTIQAQAPPGGGALLQVIGSQPAAGAATGATAGSPGSFTPDGSDVPEDLAALQASGITASPATAWTTGQSVELGDASDAHWDGDSWASGTAP